MILFANKAAPRLLYIIEFIGDQLFGKSIRVITDKKEFRSLEGPKINYSEERISSGECWIQPLALLFETDIREQDIHCFEYNGLKCFFQTGGDLSFDIFAASFYLLSRYEEYLPHQKDEYGRYGHKNSLAFKENFLDLPLVNLWLEEFSRLLKTKFPAIGLRNREFSFIPSYDIDEAYAYRHKQNWRTAGGFVKSLLNGRFFGIRERMSVLRGKTRDPYDAYDWLDSLHEEYKLKPYYFFHVGLRNGKYDKQILPSRNPFRNLVSEHAEKYEIGIHPSWKSNDRPELLKFELLKLTHIAGRQITSSRQHYIKFSLPETYHRLIENGIQNEFSMGYGSINGFRASVALSFFWYDLENDAPTGLLVHPFCFMDANSFYEQKQGAERSFEELMHYYKLIKQVNGVMITIWHNTFLGTSPSFKGWREAYEEFISTIVRYPRFPVVREEEQT